MMFKKLALRILNQAGDGFVEPLTNSELRSSAIGVRDVFQGREILPDQSGTDGVLTFSFSQPVQTYWVGVVGDEQKCKVVDGELTPSPSFGIPVEAGGSLPVSSVTDTVKVYAPSGCVVTVWGFYYA